MRMTMSRESSHESNMYDHTVQSCTDPELALLCNAVLRECFQRKLLNQDSVADLFGAFHDGQKNGTTGKAKSRRVAHVFDD